MKEKKKKSRKSNKSGIFRRDDRARSYADMLNDIENHTQLQNIQQIAENFDFQVAILGGPGVGKTSLLKKVANNYMEEAHDDVSEKPAVS